MPHYGKQALDSQYDQQACVMTAQCDQHEFTLQSKLCDWKAQNANTLMNAECSPQLTM